MKLPVIVLRNSFRICLLCITLTAALPAVSQSDDDVLTAGIYAKKYKDDDILCTSSHQYFSFGKGKNSLNDKVVAIEEESEYEFLSLKKFSSMMYPEFYNKFIQLKTFKKAVKYGSRYVVSDKSGYDRSVTDEGIFFDDSRVQYYPIRFSQKGAAARISVKKLYTDGKYLTTLYFNAPYPVKEQVIEFNVPGWLKLEFKKMNFEGQKIEVKETKKSDYTNYVFTMKEVPAYKNEENRIGRAYTDPHIIIQIKSFENGGDKIQGFDKVDDVYAWNNRLYSMAGNDKTALQPLVTKLTGSKTTDVEKIKSLYYWVQDNIRYLAYEDGYSGYIPAPAQDVASKKYGDCKGMANLLTEMLKLAGYDAHFTWIGTRHIPYSQSMPALCVNNHAITTLNLGGKTYFLDATEKYVPFNEYAFRIQGKEVMIANGDKFDIKQVPTSTAADNAIATKADFVLTNNGLTGKVKVILTGNQRTSFHQYYGSMATSRQKDFLNEYLEFGNDNMVAANVKTSDLKNRDLPVTIEGDVDLSNSVNVIGNDKYVGVDFFPKSLEKYVPNEKRVEGYDLDGVISFEDVITLTVPADKKFIDKPDNLQLSNDGYDFRGSYEITGNKITLKKELFIKNSIIKKGDFPAWIKFIDAIKEFNKYLLTVTAK